MIAKKQGASGSPFVLKADFLPLTSIVFKSIDPYLVDHHLSEKIIKAPNYFKSALVILDISQVKEQCAASIKIIIELIKSKEMIPIGIRTKDFDKLSKEDLGIPVLPCNKADTRRIVVDSSLENLSGIKKDNAICTKIIYKPVRSGMQLYAKNHDLTVLGGINYGAECIADGSIHVYGALRGRALAGAMGDESAMIFCKSLEAELVSIAGYYLTSEQIEQQSNKNAFSRVFLNKKEVCIEEIG